MYTSLSRATVAAIALVAGFACGSKPSNPGAPSGGSNTGGPFTIVINGQRGAQSFTPNPAPAGGTQVVFRNADSVAHHIRLNDGTFATTVIQPGATSTVFVMPPTGTNYHCELHPLMVGAVNAEAGPPPPCQGLYC